MLAKCIDPGKKLVSAVWRLEENKNLSSSAHVLDLKKDMITPKQREMWTMHFHAAESEVSLLLVTL